MQENLLEVRGLQTWFRNGKKTVHAVQDVSFDVKQGEILGLVGESGCGKSATCRSLIRLVQAGGDIVGGSILYAGKDIVRLSEHEMHAIRGSEIAMIFQEPMNTLNPVLTVGAQLMETLRRQGMNKQQKQARATEMLRMVGIAEPERRLHEYPHQFSGGMRQRAMIAIALAARPKLLLADEPTTALDVTIQDQIIKLLLHLKNQLSMSMILVTHDLGVASQLCDRIAVMYAGRMMEIASTRDLFDSPGHPYTRGLIRSIPLGGKGERLIPIQGTPPNLAEPIPGCPFAPRCDMAQENCFRALPAFSQPVPGHQVRCHYAHLTHSEGISEVAAMEGKG